MREYLIAGALAVAACTGLWGHGYHAGDRSGRAAEVAKTAAQIEALETRLADVSAANRAAAAELEARRIAQATLSQELEDEARKDPDAVLALSLALGAVVEAIYAVAKRKGWAL